MSNINNTNIKQRCDKQWLDKRRQYYDNNNNIWIDNMNGIWKKYYKNDYKKESKNSLSKDRLRLCYDENNNLFLSFIYWDNKKDLPKHTNDYIKTNPYIEYNNIIKYSKIKNNEDINFLNTYYFKTIDGWLYLYDKNKDKNDIISLNIITNNNNNNNNNLINYNNNDKILFKEFIDISFKKPIISNLRICKRDIFKNFKKWCELNNKKYLLKQKHITYILTDLGYYEEHSKGIGVNNKPGERGYYIDMIFH